MEIYECYHGTSEGSGLKILREKHFDASSSEDDWAGSGIYYFIDLISQEESAAYKNAKCWAEFKKRYYPPVVLKSNVSIDEESLLDLCNEYYQGQFHRFRTELFKEASIQAKRQGVNFKEEYLIPGKLDCATINKMCEAGDFEGVIRQVYIACLSYPHPRRDSYPNSFIPNCTIFCLRNERLINDTVRVEKV